MTVLCVHAVAAERGGLQFDPPWRALVTGIGKSHAAARVARSLARQPADAVLLFGVAGAYPDCGLGIGELCVVERAVLGDEGALGEQFRDLRELGFDCEVAVPHDGPRSRAVAELLGLGRAVVAATVSSCAGSEAIARARAVRTGASIETMESAAVAIACADAGVPLVELRAISNLCTERERAGWDVALAVRNLELAIRRVRTGGIL